MQTKTTWHRTKNVCLIDDDIRKISDLMAERFPQARYYMEPTNSQSLYHDPASGKRRPYPPPVLIHPSLFRISQCARRWRSDFTMVLDPDWRPMWSRVTLAAKRRYWHLIEPPKPYIWFQSLYGISSPAPGVEALHFCSRIIACCRPHDKRDLQFASLFFRLFGRLASDRNLAWVSHPDGTIRESFVDKTSWNWVGHEARRWALEHPHRYLLFMTSKGGQGLRPLQPGSKPI